MLTLEMARSFFEETQPFNEYYAFFCSAEQWNAMGLNLFKVYNEWIEYEGNFYYLIHSRRVFIENSLGEKITLRMI